MSSPNEEEFRQKRTKLLKDTDRTLKIGSGIGAHKMLMSTVLTPQPWKKT